MKIVIRLAALVVWAAPVVVAAQPAPPVQPLALGRHQVELIEQQQIEAAKVGHALGYRLHLQKHHRVEAVAAFETGRIDAAASLRP